VLLYVRGDPEVLNLPCLSIVGTRRPTLYGAQMAERLGRDLAARGLVIVSGMAKSTRGRLPEPLRKKVYELLSAEESKHIDDIIERSGLNSSEVLATLFDLEMKGIVRQSPGKQFSKVLF
jgi:predicted Rossmann fold nucleotide-binding protein DprA/Smf involved in DNA uptake